ncbi:MAG: hypothetical protein ACE5E6_10130 [Phycisphaerae bacterium]
MRSTQRRSRARTSGQRTGAFSMVELLVVVGVLGLLLAVLLPGLAHARNHAKAVVCRANIHQLAVANDLYADASHGRYAPGAADFQHNLHRWHGARATHDEPFDPATGPLAPYLDPGGAVRQCPTFDARLVGFEAGTGGYGYNNAYVGTQRVEAAPGVHVVVSDRTGAFTHRVARPAETVMFTDAAFTSGDVIPYSFAEPRFHPRFGTRADPSIHFRHARHANVAWCDGHVDAHRRTFTWSSGLYDGNPEQRDIGWFGATDDNRLFDLQ